MSTPANANFQHGALKMTYGMRFLHQLGSLAEVGVGSRGVDQRVDFALAENRPGKDCFARLARGGQRFYGQRGLIHFHRIARQQAGLGRRIVQFKPREAFFSQGSAADSIFYLLKGRAKLTVVSAAGKEATITLLTVGDFVGEESIAGALGRRLATATASVACTALKIERAEMIRVVHEEHAFSDLFLKFLLARSMRTQADLVDQLFNSSEKRLARILLLMAEFGMPALVKKASGSKAVCFGSFTAAASSG
jgi:CRP-like cAMP-binding protein